MSAGFTIQQLAGVWIQGSETTVPVPGRGHRRTLEFAPDLRRLIKEDEEILYIISILIKFLN